MILTSSQLAQIAELRSGCEACNGDDETCQRGTHCPHDGICLDDDCLGNLRLAGCKAWDDAGNIAKLPNDDEPSSPFRRLSQVG